MVNICCCVGVLFHETYAFIAFPALVFAQQSMTLRMMWQKVLYLSPAFACFVVVVLHHGDASTAQSIHDSWQTLWIQSNLASELLHKPFATIQSIGWTTEEGMHQTRGVLQNGLYQPAAWFCVVVITFLLASRFLRAQLQSKLGEWISLLVFQWFCIMPLFLLGVDYGRWIFLWIASSVILFSLGFRLPTWVAEHRIFVAFTNRLTAVIALVPCKEWMLLFFGLPILWGVMNFLNASPVGRLLWEMYTRTR